MRPLHFLIVLFNLYSTCAVCQDTLTFKEFFSKDDQKTSEAQAYYYTTGKRIDMSQRYVDTVFSYYTASNTKRSVRVYDDKGMLTGKILLFHENGKLKQEENYLNGMRKGYLTSWYADGKIRRTLQYANYPNDVNLYESDKFRIIDYWDSLGNPLITKGNGYCHCYLASDFIKEQGRVINELKDSIWSGSTNGVLSYKEVYGKGTFIKGISYYDEKSHPYSKIEEQAEFDGGMNGLYNFLRNNFRYPVEARRAGTQGKVFIQFVVEKDGSLSNIEIVKSLSKSTDAEALRIVELMPNWKTAHQRGKPVKSKFVLPIVFKLVR